MIARLIADAGPRARAWTRDRVERIQPRLRESPSYDRHGWAWRVHAVGARTLTRLEYAPASTTRGGRARAMTIEEVTRRYRRMMAMRRQPWVYPAIAWSGLIIGRLLPGNHSSLLVGIVACTALSLIAPAFWLLAWIRYRAAAREHVETVVRDAERQR